MTIDAAQSNPLQIIPLGGLGEIGKNLTVVSYGDSLLIVDCGLAFPDDEMLGVDIVIPDFSYVLKRRDQIRGIFLTHGHEDHVGAIPFLLKELDVPVFASRLTLGMIREKLKEHRLTLHKDSRALDPGRAFQRGPFHVTPFRVTHSIPDSYGYGIKSPAGTVVFTGDYKFDQTPVDDRPPDYGVIAELGRKGVLVLCGDSTNAERRGFSASEREVGHRLLEWVRAAPGRVLLATFASNVHRLQQAIDAAKACDRKVAVIGRSMENTVAVARELGYLEDQGVMIDLSDMRNMPPERCLILTTGSQGEPLSALSRMASSDHRRVELQPGDTVMLAATPVPGNEKSVQRTIDRLFQLGVEVVYGPDAGVHTSGHGAREEIKLMINLLRPQYLIPVHGEYRHMIQHSRLAQDTGIPEERVLVGENGTVFEFQDGKGKVNGRVHAAAVLVDGLGVGDVGNVVLRDRRQLAEDGIIMIALTVRKGSAELLAGPEILTRGFIYVRESESFLDEINQRVLNAVKECQKGNVTEWQVIKNRVRESLQGFLFERTRRRPVILPVVMEA